MAGGKLPEHQPSTTNSQHDSAIDQINSLENQSTPKTRELELQNEQLRLQNEQLRLQLLLQSQGNLDILDGETQYGDQFENNEYLTPDIDFTIKNIKSYKKSKEIDDLGVETKKIDIFGKKIKVPVPDIDTKSVYFEESISKFKINKLKDRFGEFIISFEVIGNGYKKKYQLLYKNGNQIDLIINGRIVNDKYHKVTMSNHSIEIEDKGSNRTIVFEIKKRRFNRHHNFRKKTD